MTAAEWALMIGAVATALVSLVQVRNAARKTDLDTFVTRAQQHAAEDEKEFQHLVSEIARLEKSLDRRREEYEQLWKEVQQLRVENMQLRAENAKLRERITELEKTAVTKPGTGPLTAKPATGD